MEYSLHEQLALDLNIFFKDKSKVIHLASGGGKIPKHLAQNKIQNDEFNIIAKTFPSIFEVETNKNLASLCNISMEDLNFHFKDFILFASKGFYSYDKTNVGNFEDPIFHLVAKPKAVSNNIEIFKNHSILNLDLDLPTDFNPFNLFDLFRSL